jgi:DNA invertase Pin-like site-specific DNA recombinase
MNRVDPLHWLSQTLIRIAQGWPASEIEGGTSSPTLSANRLLSSVDTKRPEPARCLEFVRDGDTLVVTKLDRLARSAADLFGIVAMLKGRGDSLTALDDATVDTTSRTGNRVMGILIAGFGTAIRRGRQLKCIVQAKAEGRTGGRPSLVTDDIARDIRARRAKRPIRV